jgi:hypothetical protein
MREEVCDERRKRGREGQLTGATCWNIERAATDRRDTDIRIETVQSIKER